MIEFGKVVDIEKGLARIELDRSDTCAKCGLCSTNTEKKNYLFFPDDSGLQPGDRVRIEISPKVVLKSSLITFLVPIMGIVLGIIFSILIKNILQINPDILMVISIIAFLGLSFILVKFLDKRTDIASQIKIKKLES